MSCVSQIITPVLRDRAAEGIFICRLAALRNLGKATCRDSDAIRHALHLALDHLLPCTAVDGYLLEAQMRACLLQHLIAGAA